MHCMYSGAADAVHVIPKPNEEQGLVVGWPSTNPSKEELDEVRFPLFTIRCTRRCRSASRSCNLVYGLRLEIHRILKVLSLFLLLRNCIHCRFGENTELRNPFTGYHDHGHKAFRGGGCIGGCRIASPLHDLVEDRIAFAIYAYQHPLQDARLVTKPNPHLSIEEFGPHSFFGGSRHRRRSKRSPQWTLS